jgi:hypothetical protein
MKIFIIVSIVFFLNSCTTANVTSVRMIDYDDNTKYLVEPIGNGFRLTVDYSRYQFIPESEALLTACRSALTSIAYEVARTQSETIQTINEQEIRISSGRNGLTGLTSCQATVPVFYDRLQEIKSLLDEGSLADESGTGETTVTGDRATAERLSELNALVERGLISEEEYQEARRSILGI